MILYCVSEIDELRWKSLLENEENDWLFSPWLTLAKNFAWSFTF